MAFPFHIFNITYLIVGFKKKFIEECKNKLKSKVGLKFVNIKQSMPFSKK